MPATAMLPDLVLASVREHPDAPAVLAGDQVVSYRELGDRARRVAAALGAHGVGPESAVGVLTAPGPGMVTALVGAWLAGACYVPVDPLAPAERQARVLELAGARVLLSDGQAAEPPGGRPVVRVDAPPVGEGFTPEAPTPPGRAAYMVFTSGSTGTPKGVVIEHAGITNRVLWGVRALGLTEADRILQKTPLTFDAAAWEIFAPLVTGGPVVFGRPDAGRDAGALVASLAETGATVLQLVPSLLRLLAVEPGLEECRALRTVCCAGEPLHADLCRRLRGRVDVEIWNTYGPTECSIDITAARFDPAQEKGPVPIGRPIDRMEVRLLPAGTLPGEAPHPAAPPAPDTLYELYAAGPGVGRGYHGDPAQTAERFLPDPSGPPGARMYRTGDLVRRAADGTLLFVGRADAQVKVNGVRIEPGEVEAVLERHPEVVAAAVAPVDDPQGLRRLGAWIVTADGDEPAGLTAFTRDRLPPSLVPTVTTVVAALPVTASGKTDRSRLPEPAWDRQWPERGPVVATTTEEALVLAAWREVLDLPEVGLDDDFFRLGGHSLLMTRLAALLAESSGLVPDFRRLHFAGTPRAQARLLAEAAREAPIEPLPEGARIPLSPGQERFWLQDRMHPGSPEYLLPILLWFPAGTEEAALRRAVTRLVERHDPLRTRYEMDGRGLHAVVLPAAEAVPDFTVVDTVPDGVAGQLRAALAEGFDLASAPPVRYRLIRDGGPEQLLLMVVHHIAGDGWSSRLIERDLRAFVAAGPSDSPAGLPALPVRYRDAVAWQRALLTEQVAAEQLAQWRTALDGLAPLALPETADRPPYRGIEGTGVEAEIPPEAAAALLALGREAGVSPHAVLLTLWTALLARSGGGWDFGVGTPYAGRDRPELHDLVGLFINVVVIRARLAPHLSFRAAVERVAQVCRDAFARSAVPFERVADAVEPVRDRSRTPVFQTLFTLSGDGLVGQQVGERDLRLLADAWRVARTDVALTLWPRPDGGFGGVVEYAVDVVSEPVARELARALGALAVAFAADPDTALGTPGLDAPARPEPAAGSPLTAAVLGFVREVLQREDIGPEDDVLRHGGNSLTVARLLWHVQNAFGVEASMRTFFDRPTAAALAAEVERLLQAELDGETAPARPHALSTE
ncbi:amino acid adenylation domain-containing protein [Streptomyces sp. NPDC020996]|uniref:amino acid adenylation domain-containing protein n=1 Tax=Streptomyces sp. NPDC020996 TaxID=3154791 RepID=UPI0033EBB1EF